MRRGWFHDSWRHSLAARGIQTAYLKKKPTPFSALLSRRKELLEEVRSAREGAKQAQKMKASQPENRKKLEDIRRQFAENRDRAKSDLEDINRMLKVAEEEGKASPAERKAALELDRELREQRLERAEKIQEKARKIPGEKFLPGTPTRATVRVVGRNIIGTRKADVIISGEQGKASGELEKERQRALEIKEKPEPKRAKLEIELTPEEEAAGKKLRRQKKKPRKRGRPKRKKSPVEMELEEEAELEVFDVEPPRREIIMLPTKEDAAERKRTEEEFVMLEDLEVRR